MTQTKLSEIFFCGFFIIIIFLFRGFKENIHNAKEIETVERERDEDILS
jgi:hypothetical protein